MKTLYQLRTVVCRSSAQLLPELPRLERAALLLVWLFVLHSPLALPSRGIAAERPNVLLLCIDDLKPLLGCYGEGHVHSPNIDKLAARGVRFDRAYCNQAICGPSRNAMLTGLRPQTLGIYNLSTNFRKAAPKAVTLPQHFKQNGYHTSALGKIYHTGHGNRDDAASWSEPLWAGKKIIYVLPENRVKRVNKSGKTSKYGAAFEAADVPDSTYPEGQLADKAIGRLKQAAATPEQPFFLAVGFLRPHLPFISPQKYWDLYDRDALSLGGRQTPPEGAPRFAATRWGELRQYGNIPAKGPMDEQLRRSLVHGYYAAVSYVDAQVGRVLETLEQTGLAENTIVVLWGDHGWHLGDHGMWCKHTNYEQAARVPLILSAPGRLGPGAGSDMFVESVDIYPTLCSLAGLPAPGAIDGVSFAPALEDPALAPRQAAIHVYPRGKRIGQAVRTERYRLVEWKTPGAADDTAIFELYDYQQDPQEARNLADEQPQVVARLRRLLDKEIDPRPQR